MPSYGATPKTKTIQGEQDPTIVAAGASVVRPRAASEGVLQGDGAGRGDPTGVRPAAARSFSAAKPTDRSQDEGRESRSDVSLGPGIPTRAYVPRDGRACSSNATAIRASPG